MNSVHLSDKLRIWTTPYCEQLGLPYFPNHVATVIRSLLLWYSVQLLSAGVSPILFPKTMRAMSARKRVQWDMHFVSLIHSSIISPLALYFWLNVDESKTDLVWGYDYTVGEMYAVSLGYFMWDVIQSARFESLQFVVHGALAMTAAVFVYHPFLMFDGLGILIWEASTPFLNIHWFFDKLGKTGSRAQLINAFFLLGTCISVRLVLGVVISYRLISSVWTPSHLLAHPVPLSYKLFYTIGLMVLNTLNYYWFSKMVKAVQKRFAPKEKAT